MMIAVEFSNTHPEERAMTRSLLERCGAFDVAVTADPEGNDLYRCTMAVDTDDDIANALRVMLFYNDRKVGTTHAMEVTI